MEETQDQFIQVGLDGKPYLTSQKEQAEAIKKNGRPSIYSKELALTICKRLSMGESLRRICQDDEMPNASTVHEWVLEDREGFAKQYARAREIQAENMFDEILDIADDGSNDFMTITKGKEAYNIEDKEVTNRSRLRVDSRKWYLSKVLPKKFGEKLDMTTNGKDLPVPLLYGLRNNNSGTKGSETPKED